MTASHPTDTDLLARAEALLSRAHSPYSGISVAAVLVAADGRVFEGVNVENASLGLTVCAERNALGAAVTAGAARIPGGIVTILFTSNHPEVRVPCGACRQVIAELAPAARVLFGRNGRIEREWPAPSALLPDAFDGTWNGDASR